jgi:hypothetical protein
MAQGRGQGHASCVTLGPRQSPRSKLGCVGRKRGRAREEKQGREKTNRQALGVGGSGGERVKGARA